MCAEEIVTVHTWYKLQYEGILYLFSYSVERKEEILKKFGGFLLYYVVPSFTNCVLIHLHIPLQLSFFTHSYNHSLQALQRFKGRFSVLFGVHGVIREYSILWPHFLSLSIPIPPTVANGDCFPHLNVESRRKERTIVILWKDPSLWQYLCCN